jgi:hypothetical protein
MLPANSGGNTTPKPGRLTWIGSSPELGEVHPAAGADRVAGIAVAIDCWAVIKSKPRPSIRSKANRKTILTPIEQGVGFL